MSLIRYNSINSIFRKFKKQRISIILDMEDSAQDLFDKENNKNLKKQAREGLKYLAKKNFLKDIRIFVRINSKKSTFYKKDIEIISQILKNGSEIEGIFLPKVDNYNQVKDCYEKLFNSSLKNFSIVPIIETKKGFKNLDQILFEDKNNNIIKYIHYGHYDFCLENKLWPFPEPYHFEYWKLVDKILKITINHKKKYIHTPFPLIKNQDIYWHSANYLSDKLKLKEINISLININTGFFKKKNNIKKFNLKKISNDKNYKKIFAKKIIDDYLNSKSNKKSFSLSQKRFIPPHLYLAAINFLNKK